MCQPLITLHGPDTSRPIAIGMTRFGSHVAVARENNRVELWSIEGELLGSHSMHERPVRTICVSDDGRLVATLSEQSHSEDNGAELIVWDSETSTGKRISPSSAESGFRSPIFLTNSHQLAVASNRPLFFDGATGEQVSFPFPDDLSWHAVDMSYFNEGLALATKHGPVCLVAKRVPTKPFWLRGHGDTVTNLAFCSTGNYLGTISKDGTLRFWYLFGFEEIGRINLSSKRLLHFSYVVCYHAWLVVDRTHGLRLFKEPGTIISINRLPRPSSVSTVTSDMWARVLVIGRLNGTVEIWNTLTLIPAMEDAMAWHA